MNQTEYKQVKNVLNKFNYSSEKELICWIIPLFIHITTLILISVQFKELEFGWIKMIIQKKDQTFLIG